MKLNRFDLLIALLIIVGSADVGFTLYAANSVILLHQPIGPFLPGVAIFAAALVLVLVPTLVYAFGDLSRRPIGHKLGWGLAFVFLWLFSLPIYHFMYARRSSAEPANATRA